MTQTSASCASGGDHAGVDVDAVEIIGCRIERAILTGATLRRSRFVDCRLDEANFRLSAWERAEFIHCELVGAEFQSARMPAARFERCDLRRVQLAKADLRGGSLRGSDVEGLQGAEGLRQVSISPDQLVPLALALFRGMGVAIVDDESSLVNDRD